MSRAQRDKGRRFELECLAFLRDHQVEGELRYEQPELGGQLGDIESTAGNWECKRRAGLPAWLEPAEGVRGVFCRRDRGPLLVVVTAGDLLGLEARLHEKALQIVALEAELTAIKTTIRITKGKVEGAGP